MRINYLKIFFQIIMLVYIISCSTPKQPTIDNNIDSFRSKALFFYDKGQYEKAQEAFKQILLNDPNDFISLYKLGVIYGREGKIQNSIDMFNKVIKIKPMHCKAYYNLGAIYSSNKNFYNKEKATYYFKKYLAYESDTQNRQQVELWLKENSENEQQITIQKEIKTKQNDKKDLEYKTILKNNPDDIDIRYKLAKFYFKKNKLMESRSEFLKIALNVSFDHEVYYYLGVIYSTNGKTYNKKKAQFFYQKYLENVPDSIHRKVIENWMSSSSSLN